MPTVEENRKRFLRYISASLIFLVVVWVWKLSYPQATLIKVYTDHVASTASSPAEPSSTPTSPDPGKKLKSHTSVDATLGALNGNIDNKVAVIIETRFRTNLIPLILHFGSVLGPSWPILVYTSAEAMGQFSTSSSLARYIKSGTVQIRILPQTILFTNSDSVNQFMTGKWLWESLSPAEHILLFQSDSMLCANAARSVDDYFEYDFVGAPIAKGLGKGYNGGLSLRKRSTIMRVLEQWDWEETKKDGDRFEDQWYFNRFIEYQEQEQAEGIKPEEDGAINLPSMEVARTFSVETIDYPHPLGVHQVHRWLEDQMLSLDEWCPEYKLCSIDHVLDV